MSNQVALFTNGGSLALPDHLRGLEIDEQTKALAGGGGGLRISIKGGVFRMLNNGEEIAKNDDRAMNVVVVRSSPDNSRSYYEGEYVEGESTPPTCWSIDGTVPAPDVKHKQAASCATCPQNVAGSGSNGESRACKFRRDLAVVLEGDLEGKVFKLSLPAMSIFGKIENNVMPLQAYAKLLLQHKAPVNSVVTELRFDTSAAVPKLGFKAVRFLTKEEYEIVKQQGETPEAIAATTTTVFQQDSSEGLGIAGKSPAQEDAQPAAQPAPAVVATPATTNAPAAAPAKRTRAKPAPAASNPEPAGPKMTEKAEFTYDEYKESGWTDEQLIEEGYMEAPKKAAPPPAPKAAPKAPAPKPKAAPAPAAEHVEAEPVVVEKPVPAAAAGHMTGAAAMLSQWDNDEE